MLNLQKKRQQKQRTMTKAGLKHFLFHIQIIEKIVETRHIQEKKEVDLTMIKRRVNRIKKEKQVYMPKVSLLCWIAHGNYINSVLNKEHLIGQALSLLPSQQSYSVGRIILKYLEQIVSWFSKSMKINESLANDCLPLENR